MITSSLQFTGAVTDVLGECVRLVVVVLVREELTLDMLGTTGGGVEDTAWATWETLLVVVVLAREELTLDMLGTTGGGVENTA